MFRRDYSKHPKAGPKGPKVVLHEDLLIDILQKLEFMHIPLSTIIFTMYFRILEVYLPSP